MMKHSITILASALAVTAACMSSCGGKADPATPEPTPTPTGETYLDAGIEDYQTRTTLEISGDKGKTIWASGDQIKVFDGTNSEVFGYAFAPGSDRSVGRFFVSDESTAFDVTKDMVAYYPGEKATGYSSGTITADIPATQTYVDGGFGPGAAPMVSSSYNEGTKTFTFKNVFGGVIIPLYCNSDATVSKITLTSTSTTLWGTGFQFCLNDNSISITAPVATDETKTITMSPGVSLSGTTSKAPKKFCFMMPGLNLGGETITVEIEVKDKYTYTRSFTVNDSSKNTNKLTANHILQLGALEIGENIDFSVEVAGWDKGGTVEKIAME